MCGGVWFELLNLATKLSGFPIVSPCLSTNHHLVLMWKIRSALLVFLSWEHYHQNIKKTPKIHFLHLVVAQERHCVVEVSGSQSSRPRLMHAGNPALCGSTTSLPSRCSSLKARMSPMAVLSPKRRVGIYFGKGAYFKLRDRDSLFSFVLALFHFVLSKNWRVSKQ